jgi:essential nuclear protein 1
MILMLTSPQNWTPHATYEATRLFVSNLDSNQAQRYTPSLSFLIILDI